MDDTVPTFKEFVIKTEYNIMSNECISLKITLRKNIVEM